MMSILEVKKLIALCLCVLLATGVWIPHIIGNDKNSTTDVNPAWGVRVMGTRGEPLLIYDVNDLQNMRNDLSADYALANDIDADDTKEWNDGKGFEPVGTEANHFTGSLHGRGHSIRRLYLNRPLTDYVGLFGCMGSSASVNDVGFVDADITGQFRTGALAGMNDGGSVLNCYIKGNVSGDNQVGGLIGRMGEDAVVSDCYVMGNVSGATHIGGLVGRNDGWVKNSYATATVTGTARVGGLAGTSWFGVTERSYATGNVTGTERVGGFIGYIWEDASVKDCYSTGTVTRLSGTDTYFGGFIGFNYRGKVITSYSTGPVHYTGAADPSNRGFCGYVDQDGNYEMSGNFWDAQTSGQTSTAGGATGKTTAEMKTRSTFTDAGWDFEDVWAMIQDTTYPLFKRSPSVNAGPGQTVDEGDQVVFDGSACSDEFGITNHTWTFNDGIGGISLYGVSPAHTFPFPGVITVTLTVTNAMDLSASDTMIVTVKDITPPRAHAGQDMIIEEGSEAHFDGSASTDNVGIVSYTWEFHDGIANVILYRIAPAHTFMTAGIFTVTLTVTDAVGLQDNDSMTVMVDSTPPTAHAGQDLIVNERGTAHFNGSASMDNVGIVNYTWEFHDGITNITLYGVAPVHTFVTAGLYHVILTVTDAAGLGDTDSMTAMVDSTPPMAHAGPGMIVEEGAVAHFDGSASSDNLGIVRYIWTFNDGTGNITLQGVFPAHTFTTAGIFLVTLNVTDAAGFWDTDSMTVMVDSTPPKARTGPDQTVDEGGTVVFDGSASTDNVGIVNHAWTFHDGTGVITLRGVAPAHTFMKPGTFTVTLTAMDGVGHEHSDTMTVTVRDITPPVANAGPDQTVGKGSTVMFNGSASSDNVGIANYTWTFLHGGIPVSLHGVSPVFRFGKEGDHTVTLTVSDAGGNTAFDTMTVTVEPEDDDRGNIINGDRRIMIIPIVILFIVILGVFLVRRTPKRLDTRDTRDQQVTRDAPAPFPSASPHPGAPSPAGSPASPAAHSFAPVLPDPTFGPLPHDPAPHPPASTGVWFCAKCGTKLEDKYVFCLECGSRRRG